MVTLVIKHVAPTVEIVLVHKHWDIVTMAVFLESMVIRAITFAV
jgi:hypothetical protein